MNDIKLSNATLLHGVYRSLLNTGRTYAAFRDKQLRHLVDSLSERGEILDPMAGYGCLMMYCSRSTHALRTYNIECNPPSYFWQLLIHPGSCEQVENLADMILSEKRKWPRIRDIVDTSESWFPERSLILLEKLWLLCLSAANKTSSQPHQMCLAFLLPFVARLGSFVQGNVVTHVKPGGICVYSGWKEDFETYIKALRSRVDGIRRECKQNKHTVLLADARTCRIPHKRFSAMITSPPYPNGRNYSMMFAPENAFIEWLVSKRYVEDISPKMRLIGSPVVAEINGYQKKQPKHVKSAVAREFLAFLETYDKSKRAVEDNRVYYIPYYSNYFYDLETAYENIAKLLRSSAKVKTLWRYQRQFCTYDERFQQLGLMF